MKTIQLMMALLLAGLVADASGQESAAPAPAPTPAAAAPAAPTVAAAPSVAAAPAPTPAVAAAVVPASVTPPAASTTAPAAPAAPARNIRFQFDGLPYADAIERFAQMAGKPLIAATNIAGTLTFSDPNAYTYPEALDTLNLMLAMKGVLLVEADQYLRLVPLKELPAMPVRILRGTDQPGDVRPGEVVTVVLDLKNVEGREIVDAITMMLSNAGSVAPLPRGRGLIITDRLASIQRVRSLLGTIDVAATVDRQMKTYTLLHSSGGIISDLLNRTFGLATAPKRTSYNPNTKAMEVLPPDPADYITSVYDEASRTIVLFGPRDRIALAEELINRFEQKDGPGGDVRIYFPQSIKADELATIIRQAVPGVAASGETAAAAATKARIIADNSQNRLIVAAPIPGQMEQIENLINRVDKPVHGQTGAGNVPLRSQTVQLTKVFRPRAAGSTNLASILTQALTRRTPGGQVVTTASVSHDPGSQSVIVSGSPGDLQIATDIVSQIETGSTQPTPVETRFIEIGTAAETKRLQPLVEQLYRDQLGSGSFGPVAHAKILADPDQGRLIVTASADHLARIQSLVAQLRSDKGVTATRRLEIVPLQHARVEASLASIQGIVAEKMTDRRFSDLPKPSLVSDPVNNRLLVTATPEQLEEILQVVKVIDVAPAAARRELKVIPLRAKTAAELIPVATALLEQTAEQPANPQLAPRLMPDPNGRQIIALALPADFERVEKIVGQLDVSQATSAPREFRAIELYSRSAAELTPLVSQLYSEQLRGQPEPAGGPASLIAETKQNRIMVSGAGSEITRVEALIRQLDPAEKKGAKDETRVIRLKTAQAAELAGLVEKSLNAQSQLVKVLVDTRSNSLVVSGDSGSVEAASEVIRQLDARADVQPREMRIIELKQGEAGSVASLAVSLAVELIKDQRGSEYQPQLKIVPDAVSNRLIVSGPKDELVTAAGVVEQLDQAPEGAGGARVFKLVNADAAKVVGVVSNAMLKFDARNQPIRRVSVSHDRESNSIVVSGSRNDLKDAEGIIQRLDNEGFESVPGGAAAGRTGRELKIITVRGEDPDSLAALALQVFSAQNPGRVVTNLVSITPEPNGKRLIVLAPAGLLPQVQAVIDTLDSAPEQGARELHTVELKNSSGAELLPKVNQIYGEQSRGRSLKPATLYPDASGKRLMVFGTKEQAAAITQIVAALESEARPPRETRTFDVGRLAEAQRILPLAKQLYRDQVTGNPALGPADAQIISDGKTGRIVVSAAAGQMTVIEGIINGLQVATPAGAATRETRAFEVGTAADVQRIQPLLQQLYQDQWKDRGDADPADAQIVADARTGRILATGKPDHLRQIEAILQQLGAGKARPELRDTRVYDLSTASAVELATTVRTLYTEQARSRLGSQPPDTLITPDAGGNRVIVVGETNELEIIEGIIQKLDKVSAQSATARVFKLKSADPDKVAEILSSSLVRYDAYGRAQRRAAVSVDAKTRTLIVTGDPKELQGVSVIIEQLDQSLGERPERRMKVVTIKTGRAADLIGKVRQLYNDQVKSQPDLAMGDALILESSPGNQIILAGTAAQLDLIERILNELQAAQQSQAPRETRFFEVGDADDLGRLQPLVQQLYTDQWRDRAAGDPADARIITDARNARLVVTARPDHLEAIGRIIADLTGPATAAEPRDTRVYDLSSSSAAELSTTVQSLYQEALKGRMVPPAGQARILPDLAANRLVVSGTSNELAIVDGLVAKLDKVSAKSGGARVFKLKNADPTQVGRVLSESLVQINRSGTRVPRVSVGPDPANSLLVVTGETRDLQSAALIVEEMDAIATRQPRLMRIVPLTSGLASQVSTRVRQLYQEQLKGQSGAGTPDALIIGDDVSSRLILTATEPHMKLLEEIVARLQEAGEGKGRQIRVLTLQRNSARSLTTMISQLFARQVASQDPAERVVVTPSGDERTLVIEAARANLDHIEELVRQVDQAEDDAQGVIQTVHLKKGNAVEVAEAVNKALSSRSPRLQRINVTAVAGANSLLINGSTNSVPEVLKIVQELDGESTGGEIEVRVYKLENGNVREVQGVINQLLDSVSRSVADRGGSRRQRATVTIDERANSLIVAGTPAHFQVVEKLLPTLDKAPERSDRDVQFIWLRKAKAYDVVSKVEAVFSNRPDGDRPVIEADSFNNSVTVIARRGDIAQVQDLIARLDDTAKDSSIQVRFRPLERVAAEQMARMLQNIYPQMSQGRLRVVEKVAPPADGKAPGAPTAPAPAPAPPAPGDGGAGTPEGGSPEVVISVDKEANSLILSGPAQELDHIDEIISDLSFSFFGNEAEFRLFPLKEADPVAVARTLGDLMKQDPVMVPQQPGQPPRTVTPAHRITVVAEPRTRSLIVRARPTDFPLVESLVKQLDVGGLSAQLDFRVVPLTNAPPQKVLPLVQQMVTQLNLARPGDPLTVSVEPRTRGLLVIARGTVADQVEKMIRQLDTPAAYVEAEVMVVALKKASAPQLATVLQSMLRPGAQGEWPAEARELQEQVRRLKVQNEKGDAVLLDLTKPIKIAADPTGGGQGGGNRLLLTSTPDNLKALAAVVAMMDSVPVLEDVVVKLLPLRHADAAAVSQTLTTIFTQGRQLGTGPAGPGAQPEGAAGKALVNPLNVSVDARSNTIILSGQIETMNLALRVVADLDKPIERFVTEVKLFRLKHASATRIVPLLQSVFAEGTPVPGTEGLSTQVSRLRVAREGAAARTSETAKARAALLIQADDASNVLIVAARSDTLPLIQEVIDQLDIPAASGLETVRIYPLNHADPAGIQRLLNEIYTSPRAAATMRNEDKPVISVDPRTSALVVAGNSKSFGIIEGLLQQLDQKLPFELRDIRLVPLQNADAAVVAATIQKLMDARLTQRATLNQGAADTLKVTVMSDSRSNSLLVAGGRESFEMVESLAAQLDKAGTALSGRIRLVPLQFADARVLAATLTTLFTERYAAMRAPDVQRNKPVILADPRSNSLLVTANQEDNGAIDELLKKLDAKNEHPSLLLTVVPLKHNDSARVATLIEGVFAARLRAQTPPGQTPLPSEQIEVQPDPLNNALVISASKENLELIQELLPKIDVEPSVEGGVLETFPLQFADAQRVATLLNSLVQQGLYRPGLPAGAQTKGTPRDALAISVDPRTNTLLVSASPENLAVVRAVIQRVDTKDYSAAMNVRLYALKKARASSLATTLEQFFRAKRAGDTVAANATERTLPVGIIPDDRVNTLLVTGGKEAFDVIDNILPQLDAESAFARMNFKVFPLKKATARKLQATLQQIVANRPPKARGEAVDPITIVADQWVNALLVGASVDDMATVESLIERLDTEPAEAGMAIHVFPLAKGDARRVAQTIQGLFRDGTGGGGTGGPGLPVTVSADERINAIVVSCGEVDAKRIGELVRKLDTEQVARVSEIKVFGLKYARAESLSAILETALNTKPTPLTEQSPNAQSVLQFITRTEEGEELVTAALKEAVLITADARMNSLIVSAPVDYMGLLEQIITRLDSSAPQHAKIKVFPLQNSDAGQMAQLLMQLFRMTPTGGPAAQQRSIQYTLVRPVPAGANREGEQPLATATLGTAEQNALTVTVDQRTNSLLVGGTEHYVSLVSQIIESLDSSPANERRTEIVRLKNNQAPEVATAIRTFLDQERLKIVQVLGSEGVGTAQRMLEREVAVVAEPTSNTLLVSANPRYFEQIKALLDELDKPQPQVLIQVLLAEVTLDNTTDLGVEWSYTGSSGDVTYGVGTDFNVADQLTQFGGFSSAISGSDFNFLIRALKNEGRLEVLSRPQIVTGDNKPASINIGQRVPLITDSRVTDQGDTINSFRYEDVGVNLSVTPKISPDGFVRMEIFTTNSAISSSTVEINKSATVPIINQRRANTTVSVQSGQTIIIGGLIATVDDRRVKKMPILGDIPYVGALFRSSQNKKDRKELLILLTPQILENPLEPGKLLTPAEITREALDNSVIKDEIKRDEMQRRLLDPIYPPLEPPATPPPVQPEGKPRATKPETAP